jgi:hypothetical protein
MTVCDNIHVLEVKNYALSIKNLTVYFVKLIVKWRVYTRIMKNQLFSEV